MFIDEIHTLPLVVAESILYSAMQDGRITYTEGKGKFAKTCVYDLPPFTLIGATTENPSFEEISILPHQKYIQVVNKIDKITSIDTQTADSPLQISAKCNIGIDSLRTALRKCTDTSHLNSSSVVVTNMRHYAALEKASESLEAALTAMDNNLPSDLLSEDIRQTLHHLGEITGDITSDDILHSIFANFCIGK